MFNADVLNTCITALASIAVAVIGFIQMRESKKNEADRALRAQNEQLQEEKRQHEKEEQDEQMREMKEMITALTEEVKELRQDYDISNIEKQLNTLHFLNEFNFEYIQSLSSVVINMGDALSSSSTIDDGARGTLRDEITRHKKMEKEITQKLIKIVA